MRGSNKMGNKVLTEHERIKVFGKRPQGHLTIPNEYTYIGAFAFWKCARLTSITIPDSVTSIGKFAFYGCTSLESKNGRYKAFDLRNNKILCREYEYTPNKWSDEVKNIKLGEFGYHFCTNLFELFNHYSGELDKEIAIYECEIGGLVIMDEYSSMCVTNKIKPLTRLHKDNIINILNG